MNELQVFQHTDFGELGILYLDGKPLFPATECAKILSYSNPRDAILRHCRGVVKHDAWVQTGVKADGAPAMRNSETNFIPEGDLYRLITHSKLPAAERFESWVFDEVLPAIRRTGQYRAPKPRQRRKPCDIVFSQRLRMADAFAKVTGVPPEIAQAIAINEAERITGEDFTAWKNALPARSSALPVPSLNATAVGERLGIDARAANLRLEAAGLQRKADCKWRLTEAGRLHGEEMPFERKGHADYRILWRDSVVDMILS